MADNNSNNPFDTADDTNPFQSVEDYNPFAQSKPPSPPPSGPAPSSEPPIYDGFHATETRSNDPLPNYYDASNAIIEQEVPLDSDNPFDGPSMPSGQPHVEPMQREDMIHNEEYSFWQLGYYQSLFNVDTVDVLDRIFRASVPFRRNFFPTIKPNPDLYGLVWICATLVFVVAAAGNFANYIIHKIEGTDDWEYNFSKLPWGAAVIFGYNGIVPLILWGVLIWVDDFDISLPQMWCLYGYSMFIFIPAAIVSAIPTPLARWIAVSVACGISILHLLISMGPQLAMRRKASLILLIVVAILHAGLALSFVLYFFDVSTLSKAPAPTPEVAQPV